MEPETLKPQEKTQNNKIEEKKDDSSVEVAGEDLERAIEVFGNLPKDQQTILSRGIFAIQQSYSGPLPPAREFREYKEVMPDAPKRILAMAEKNQEHRIQLTNKSEKHDYIKTLLGQIFAFVLSLSFGGGAIYLGMEGHDWLAGILGCTTVVSLATIFVLNKLPQFNKEQQE